MKKNILGVLVVLVCLVGSYFFMEEKAKSAAEKAIADIERNIEASIPNSDFTFGTVVADFFANSAIFSDLALKVDGETLATAKSLAISGDAKTIKRAEIVGLEGAFKKSREQAELSIKKAVLLDADVTSINAVINDMKSNPTAATEALNNLLIGAVKLSDFFFTGIDTDDGRQFIVVNGELNLAGVANGVFRDLTLSGLLRGDVGFNGLEVNLGNLSVSRLHFADIANAFVTGNEPMLREQMLQALGASDLTVEGLNFTNPEIGLIAGLINGKIKIADNVVKDFSLQGLDFQNTVEKISTQVGEARFSGLNMSIDFTSDKTVMENAAKLFGLTDISIKNASFSNNGNKIALAEFIIADVAFEGDVIVKGKTSINGLKVPLFLINEIDRSAARTIGNFTDNEDLVLSLSTSVDFNTEDGTFDTEINFGADGFAKVSLICGLAGLDAKQIQKASKVSDIFEAMQIWALIVDDLSISGVTLKYVDEQLANTVLAGISDNELATMSEMQVNIFLEQYPKMADQLKIALGAFLDGKNSFNVLAKAESPLKIDKMQQLFDSGELTNFMSFEFSGN